MTEQEVKDNIFLVLADIWDTQAKLPVIEHVSMLHKLKEPLVLGSEAERSS
jgi:hypothetical protein